MLDLLGRDRADEVCATLSPPPRAAPRRAQLPTGHRSHDELRPPAPPCEASTVRSAFDLYTKALESAAIERKSYDGVQQRRATGLVIAFSLVFAMAAAYDDGSGTTLGDPLIRAPKPQRRLASPSLACQSADRTTDRVSSNDGDNPGRARPDRAGSRTSPPGGAR